jgi:hypothetical protein
MKQKLNEIENKYYNLFEQNFEESQGFKKYHKTFLKFIQKMNKEVKKSNSYLIKESVLTNIKQFVR